MFSIMFCPRRVIVGKLDRCFVHLPILLLVFIVADAPLIAALNHQRSSQSTNTQALLPTPLVPAPYLSYSYKEQSSISFLQKLTAAGKLTAEGLGPRGSCFWNLATKLLREWKFPATRTSYAGRAESTRATNSRIQNLNMQNIEILS